MKELHYRVNYRNGDRISVFIAEFSRTNSGKFVFEYCDNPRYEFPGFDKSQKRHESDTLWSQISFRVPNVIRDQNPGIPTEELLTQTGGKLATDHFEFESIEGQSFC